MTAAANDDKKPSKRRELAANRVWDAERFVTIEFFASLIGLSVESVRNRRDRGEWDFFVKRNGTVYADRWGYRAYMQCANPDTWSYQTWVNADHPGQA